MGAGILPVCKVNGIILFLFGKEGQARGNQWSDFGGSRDGKKHHIKLLVAKELKN